MFAHNQNNDVNLYPQLPSSDDSQWQQALVLERRRRLTVIRDIPEDNGMALHHVHSGDMIYIIRGWRYGTWIAAMVGYRIGWLNLTEVKPRLLDPNQYYTPIPTYTDHSIAPPIRGKVAESDSQEAPTQPQDLTYQAEGHQDTERYEVTEKRHTQPQLSTYYKNHLVDDYSEHDEDQMAWPEEVSHPEMPKALLMNHVHKLHHEEKVEPHISQDVSSKDVNRIIRFLKSFIGKRN